MNDNVLFFIAIAPIILLMVSLGVWKHPAHRASVITMLFSFTLAILVWGMSIQHALTAALEGAAIGLWPIMIVIIAAIFTYNLAVETRSMDIIKNMLSRISTDERIQVLILAWGFGGFLEAVAGYGTAVAIPASILASLGFNPIFSAVICLIANTVPTAFGAVGIPVTTLAKVTNLDVLPLSNAIGIQLALFIVIIPFVLVIMTRNSVKGLKGVMGITCVSGLAFAVPQVLAAKYLGAELPALLGSITSLVFTIMWAKIFHKDKQDTSSNRINLKQGLLAWLPYILIFIFITLSSPLFPYFNELLSGVKSNILIYTGAGAKPTAFKWIGTPGVLIILATLLAGLVQGCSIKQILNVFFKTLQQLMKSTITVVSIVAMAKLMAYSGMIKSIALVLVQGTGKYFPLIAPIIGTLGTFITGSDTSSNILFGALQSEVSLAIGVDPYWLAAANTSGATAGKMISPQSIAVATSATGMIGMEGKIFNSTIKFCLVYVLLLGVLVYVGTLL